MVCVQRANRLVEAVPYTTCPGSRVSTLATNEGVYKKNDDGFVLTGCFPSSGVRIDERLNQIRQTCGWEFRSADAPLELEPPTPVELALVRSFDPERVFIG